MDNNVIFIHHLLNQIFLNVLAFFAYKLGHNLLPDFIVAFLPLDRIRVVFLCRLDVLILVCLVICPQVGLGDINLVRKLFVHELPA